MFSKYLKNVISDVGNDSSPVLMLILRARSAMYAGVVAVMTRLSGETN
jgi:hypothetical protein